MRKKGKRGSDRDRDRKKSGRSGSERWTSNVITLLQSNAGKTFTLKLIAQKLQIKKRDDLKQLGILLDKLVREGALGRTGDGYTAGVGREQQTGIVDHVSSRFAYVKLGNEQPDVFIKTRDLRSAVDGDTVTIAYLPTRHGEHPEGKVVEILKRARTRFVGKVEVSRNYAFVVPDYRKMHQDFFIHPENINGARSNDKVIFEVTAWAVGDKSPEAKVVEILGKAGEHEAEIHSIMAEFGLPFRFPAHVEAEANAIDEGFTPSEISKRRDFRPVTTFTIDPEDAKDFDDALSIKKLGEDEYEIGVHIADVTHYVKPNTRLEEEAFDRATSVYLVDRTIPMLPEKLSNNLCSLRPHEDKFTFSAVFVMDGNGKISNEWFGRTIIHSDRRFTYEEAQEVLETKEGDFSDELLTLNRLALRLRKERFRKGAVNFETVEVKFKLDEQGKPIAVVPKIRKDAHKLIEEFMLLANRQVATFIYEMNKSREKNTFVYRTHDNPDPEKVKDFALFARQFGHKISIEEGNISQSLNKLMEEIEGKPEQGVLEQLAVRAMAKAKYTTDAKGHFGLAFKHYTHFTSPIRRYPDVMVHRLLQHYLDEGNSVNKAEYEKKCEHSSEREKRAADAERASIKYKQVEYMTYAEKRAYEGLISGVTEWGIYVEIIETKCEGMIRMADLDDDFYEYDERKYRIVGKRRGRVFTLGDKVKVTVKKTDIDKRLIDLVLAKEE